MKIIFIHVEEDLVIMKMVAQALSEIRELIDKAKKGSVIMLSQDPTFEGLATAAVVIRKPKPKGSN